MSSNYVEVFHAVTSIVGQHIAGGCMSPTELIIQDWKVLTCCTGSSLNTQLYDLGQSEGRLLHKC